MAKASPQRQIAPATQCKCEHAIELRDYEGRTIAHQCTTCLRVMETRCPACGEMFPDSQKHGTRDNFGVCAWFFKRGRTNVPSTERTAWVEAERKKRAEARGK